MSSVDVNIGGKTLTAAPLNFKMLQKYGPFIDSMLKPGAAINIATDMVTVRDMLFASLKRNHPDLEPDWFDDNLDMKNIPDALAAVLAASVPQGAATGDQKPVASNGQPTTGTNATST
jgi:hypothetical protein